MVPVQNPDMVRGQLMFVKPANMDVGIREFSQSVYMLIGSQRRSTRTCSPILQRYEETAGTDGAI